MNSIAVYNVSDIIVIISLFFRVNIFVFLMNQSIEKRVQVLRQKSGKLLPPRRWNFLRRHKHYIIHII